MVVTKRTIIPIFFALVALAISIYAVIYNASPPAIISASEEVGVVKIPPQIEGFIPADEKKAQSLKTAEIEILTKNGKSYKYTVELAITPKEKNMGMMFRDMIDRNTAMLFIFEEVGERSFWMKNTLIPLDVLFINSDGIITHIHHMAEENSLEPISSNGKVKNVLEIAGGEAEILGINIGDQILYKDF